MLKVSSLIIPLSVGLYYWNFWVAKCLKSLAESGVAEVQRGVERIGHEVGSVCDVNLDQASSKGLSELICRELVSLVLEMAREQVLNELGDPADDFVEL